MRRAALAASFACLFAAGFAFAAPRPGFCLDHPQNPHCQTSSSTSTSSSSSTTSTASTSTATSTSTTTVSTSTASSTSTNTTTTAPPAGSSLALIRVDPAVALPADLSRYRVLFLDSSRYRLVAGLKAQYPKLQVLAYKNLGFVCDWATTMDDNSGVTWAEAQLHPDWWLTDASGVRQASRNFSQCWFMDPGSTGYQQAWATDVLGWLAKAPWDGVALDDVNADDGWHLNGCYSCLAKYPTRDAYRAAMRSALAYTAGKLKAAGYAAIPNIGAARDQAAVFADWSALASGATLEHFLKWPGATDQVFRNTDWDWHTGIMRSVRGEFVTATTGPLDNTKMSYVRASLLLFAKPGDAGAWSPDDSGPFACDPGAPLGIATQTGSTWTRPFTRGPVSVDTVAGTASLPC